MCQRSVPIIEAMVIDMDEARVRTVQQARQVLQGRQALQFSAAEGGAGATEGAMRCCDGCSSADSRALIAERYWPTCSTWAAAGAGRSRNW